jgi:phage-related protein
MSAIEYTMIIPAADYNTITQQNAEEQVITFDRGLSRQSQPRILQVSFGDGYEQRAIDGINSIEETFSASFNNRDYLELNLIRKFFELKAGVTNFTINITNTVDTPTPAETHEAINVICSTWSNIYQHTTNYALTATFKRVYEP